MAGQCYLVAVHLDVDIGCVQLRVPAEGALDAGLDIHRGVGALDHQPVVHLSNPGKTVDSFLGLRSLKPRVDGADQSDHTIFDLDLNATLGICVSQCSTLMAR